MREEAEALRQLLAIVKSRVGRTSKAAKKSRDENIDVFSDDMGDQLPTMKKTIRPTHMYEDMDEAIEASEMDSEGDPLQSSKIASLEENVVDYILDIDIEV
jgi:hypothetical protein